MIGPFCGTDRYRIRITRGAASELARSSRGSEQIRLQLPSMDRHPLDSGADCGCALCRGLTLEEQKEANKVWDATRRSDREMESLWGIL
ncbi:MAG: hypothetical protein CMP14_10765 [Rickettsiales bacterium]|nr:hypothetical protein [Rickettsiales bacterium]